MKLFGNITSEDKNKAVESLIEHSSPDLGFFVMVVLSISMATFALLLDNLIVLIGSMLIAPVIYSILGTSLGITMADGKLIFRSFYTLLKSAVISILISAIIALIFIDGDIGQKQIIQSITTGEQTLISGILAIIAGFAAAYAFVKPKLNEALPGVAISISIVPPLAVAGIGLAHFNWGFAQNGLVLFLVNVVGIMIASTLVFSLFNLDVKKAIAKATIKKEDQIIQQEKEA